MNRSRAKAVGLGLALLAGELRAQDAGGVPAAVPNPLPRDLRATEWGPVGAGDPGPVWLPARPPTRPTAPPAPAVIPTAVPAPVRAPEPVTNASGPRAAVPVPAGDRLPTIPEVPQPAPPPQPLPVAISPAGPTPAADGRDWRPVAPATRPVLQPPPMQAPAGPPPVDRDPPPGPLPPPRAVAPPPSTLPGPKPQPGPVAVPTDCELPTAPPALLRPAGTVVPGKHGTFGSPPIRISRDYPPLAELISHDSGYPGHRRRLFADPGAAATDRLQFQAEYLLWWVPADRVPPLATTTVAPGATPSLAAGNGFLGDPSTRLLVGDGPLGGTARQGLRLRGGWWFDDCGKCGVDASYFVLGRKSEAFLLNSDAAGSPVITRPFFAPNANPATGAVIGETGEIVAFPNFAAGILSVQASSLLWGADVNLRHAFCRTCGSQAWGFAGYRFLSLSEGVQLTEFITALPGNPTDPVGTRVVVQDGFQTRNQFHGGQVGVGAERNWGRVSLDVRASVAVGNTHQTLDIDGGQIRVRPGATTPMVFRGGLLAAGPNLGQFTSDRFSVVPEATLNLGFWVTPAVKLYAGYNFLYWSNVIRPGDQIDRVVDVTFVPNPPLGVGASGLNRPRPLLQQSDLWVQGAQFGVEWRW